jgi:hypothetical protein
MQQANRSFAQRTSRLIKNPSFIEGFFSIQLHFPGSEMKNTLQIVCRHKEQ